MITGDHAVTAAAIARELGIEGTVLTGAEFGAMTDDEADGDRRRRGHRAGHARSTRSGWSTCCNARATSSP